MLTIRVCSHARTWCSFEYNNLVVKVVDAGSLATNTSSITTSVPVSHRESRYEAFCFAKRAAGLQLSHLCRGHTEYRRNHTGVRRGIGCFVCFNGAKIASSLHFGTLHLDIMPGDNNAIFDDLLNPNAGCFPDTVCSRHSPFQLFCTETVGIKGCLCSTNAHFADILVIF